MVLAGVFVSLLLAPVTAAGASPITENPADKDGVQPFIGAPWTARPVQAPAAPRHPFMAPNERSNIHSDAYQTDTNRLSGPLGRDTEALSASYFGVCGSVTFDTKGRIVTVCVGAAGPRLYLLDPRTLEQRATFMLPPRQSPPTNIFQDFAGGGYFYLDDKDRAVIPTTTRHVYVVREEGSGFALDRDYDVSASLTSGDKIISALPDWSGRIWFASTKGVMGVIDPRSGAVKTLDTREEIQNSFAVDASGGVYLVTIKALYRMDARPDGTPVVTWREEYPNSQIAKPGQVDAGSGTTPTLMGSQWVSITDNADPMDIVVYKRAAKVDGPREVCRAPVFGKGASASDNSLIGAGRAMVVENNYGYTGPAATFQGGRTTPGVERVDIDKDGKGCRKVWHSDEVSPSVVPKLSLANGLVYLYTKEPGSNDPWYVTAVDFRTGKTAWKRNTGTGIGFNNNYAPVTIGPDGTAYVGVIGGLVAVRDKVAPPQPGPPPRPRLALAGSCSRGKLSATLSGADLALVRRVVFTVDAKRAGRDTSRPFAFASSFPGARAIARLAAQVTLRDGRTTVRKRSVRRCA
jgi:outer membrane protein assembly factor BamB